MIQQQQLRFYGVLPLPGVGFAVVGVAVVGLTDEGAAVGFPADQMHAVMIQQAQQHRVGQRFRQQSLACSVALAFCLPAEVGAAVVGLAVTIALGVGLSCKLQQQQENA
eukprot:9983-Heterococcus_DN1.PRE.5